MALLAAAEPALAAALLHDMRNKRSCMPIMATLTSTADPGTNSRGADAWTGSAPHSLGACTPPGLIDRCQVWAASPVLPAASSTWYLLRQLRYPPAPRRDMVVLLKDTYPAALMSDLRHFSIAALYDVFGAFPESFVATSPPNVPPHNLSRFISTVEALVTISRSHVGDAAENLFSRVPLQGTPSKRLSLLSLPSLQASPRAIHPHRPHRRLSCTCNHALRFYPMQGRHSETQRSSAMSHFKIF